jgi:spore maturation protein CgeB
MESKLVLSILILVTFFLYSCSPDAIVYKFKCNEQSSEIINTYVPQVLFSMGYETKKSDSIPNCFIATKKLKATNKKKGLEIESIQMIIKYNYDNNLSEITQYYLTEINGKVETSTLSKEQVKIFESDATLFKEKMIFYCNSNFKGR